MLYKVDKTPYKEFVAKDCIEFLCRKYPDVKKLLDARDDIYCRKNGRVNKTKCMKVLGWSKHDTPKLDILFLELKTLLEIDDE